MNADTKVALVTGGGKRVGKAISLALHNKGYRVIIHCNSSTDEATELMNKMYISRPDSVQIVQGDFSNNVAETAKQVVENAALLWGRLDLVVNNASNFVSSSLLQLTPLQWDSSIDVNLKTPVFIMQAATPFLKEHKGSIVNISDLIGLKPKPSHFSHYISKAGLINATLAAAVTLAPEIRVNAIVPGCVLWPDIDPHIHDQEENQKWISSTPLKRHGTPEDVAEAVLYLSSSEANFITGQILKLDGGRSLVF